jgi:hypothetical protein
MQVTSLKHSKLFSHLERTEKAIEAKNTLLRYQTHNKKTLHARSKNIIIKSLVSLKKYLIYLEGQGAGGYLHEYNEIKLLIADYKL